MKPERTQYGKVAIYEVATGRRIERWPVDARRMIECGEFTAEPPEGPEANQEDGSKVEQDSEKGGQKAPVVPGLAAERASRLLEQWDQKVTPEDYLQRWPTGPNAELAQQIVDLKAEATQSGAKVSTAAEATPAAPLKLPEGSRKG